MTYEICVRVRDESRVLHLFTARMENGEYPCSQHGDAWYDVCPIILAVSGIITALFRSNEWIFNVCTVAS